MDGAPAGDALLLDAARIHLRMALAAIVAGDSLAAFVCFRAVLGDLVRLVDLLQRRGGLRP